VVAVVVVVGVKSCDESRFPLSGTCDPQRVKACVVSSVSFVIVRRGHVTHARPADLRIKETLRGVVVKIGEILGKDTGSEDPRYESATAGEQLVGADLSIVEGKGLLRHLLYAVSYRFLKWLRQQQGTSTHGSIMLLNFPNPLWCTAFCRHSQAEAAMLFALFSKKIGNCGRNRH
jgi:hypothetical protein